jgi:hypothetical protein
MGFIQLMCMQCVTGVSVAAVATATGLRAWIAVHRPAWLTPPRLRLMTAGLVTAGVVAAGIQL